MEKNNKHEEEKRYNSKKTCPILVIILFILMLITILITIVSTIKSSGNLAFLNYKFYIMQDESKPNIASIGDLVIVKKTKPGQIKPGDSIVYSDTKIYYYANNAIQIRENNKVNKIVIAEKNGIKYQFSEDSIEGKVVANIDEIGNIIIFLKTPIGLIVFIIFIICLFLLLRIIFIKCQKEKVEDDKIKTQKIQKK